MSRTTLVVVLCALVATSHAFNAMPAFRMSSAHREGAHRGATPGARTPLRAGFRLDNRAARTLSVLRAEADKASADSEELEELKATGEAMKKSFVKLLVISFTLAISTIVKWIGVAAKWFGRVIATPFTQIMKLVKDRADTDIKIVKDKVQKDIEQVKKMEVDMLEQRLKKAKGEGAN